MWRKTGRFGCRNEVVSSLLGCLGLMVWGSGFGLWGLGFRVKGPGVKVQGSRFRV